MWKPGYFRLCLSNFNIHMGIWREVQSLTDSEGPQILRFYHAPNWRQRCSSPALPSFPLLQSPSAGSVSRRGNLTNKGRFQKHTWGRGDSSHAGGLPLGLFKGLRFVDLKFKLPEKKNSSQAFSTPCTGVGQKRMGKWLDSEAASSHKNWSLLPYYHKYSRWHVDSEKKKI